MEGSGRVLRREHAATSKPVTGLLARCFGAPSTAHDLYVVRVRSRRTREKSRAAGRNCREHIHIHFWSIFSSQMKTPDPEDDGDSTDSPPHEGSPFR